MKQIILFAALLIGISSCESSADKTKQANLALVKEYLHAVENKDSVKMGSLLADNYVGYGPSFTDSVNKEDAIKNFADVSRNLYESLKYTQYQNIAVTVKEGEEAPAGDWVSTWAHLEIKYKDGRGPVHLYFNAVYKIVDGKIAVTRTFYNEADVLRQLGYTFTKASE